MNFRDDDTSNLVEDDWLNTNIDLVPDQVLMNPPFALEHDYEWKFVDRSLEIAKDGVLHICNITDVFNAFSC